MPNTKPGAHPIRNEPPSVNRPTTRPKPTCPAAASKPAVDDIRSQLRQARERATAIVAQLHNLDVDLRLLDQAAHCAALGEQSSLFRAMRLRLGRVTLPQAYPSLPDRHD